MAFWSWLSRKPQPAIATPWFAFGASVRGASHARSGLENQDAIGWIPAESTGPAVVLSVADGHGSARSFRSRTGAELAITVSHALATELLAAAPTRAELSMVKASLELDVPQHIVREWRSRVEQHLATTPFTDEEFKRLAERDGPGARDAVEKDPYLAYGSTLITAVALESSMVFWQIGDGDVLTVSASGNVGRPLQGDDRLIANETTSLCSADAWQMFRAAVYGTPAPVILASTDGFANSFQDDDGFFRFGSDVLRMLVEDGLYAVSEKLPGWLEQMTKTGSGDDISLGVICRPAAFPETATAPPQSTSEAQTIPRANALGAQPQEN